MHLAKSNLRMLGSWFSKVETIDIVHERRTAEKLNCFNHCKTFKTCLLITRHFKLVKFLTWRHLFPKEASMTSSGSGLRSKSANVSASSIQKSKQWNVMTRLLLCFDVCILFTVMAHLFILSFVISPSWPAWGQRLRIIKIVTLYFDSLASKQSINTKDNSSPHRYAAEFKG